MSTSVRELAGAVVAVDWPMKGSRRRRRSSGEESEREEEMPPAGRGGCSWRATGW